MEIAVSASDDDSEVVHAFYEWLRADVEVRRSAEVKLRGPESGSGQMGAVEVINVVLSNVTALGSLAISYASWRKSRVERPRQAPPLRFTVGEVSVELRDGSQESIDRLKKLGDEHLSE